MSINKQLSKANPSTNSVVTIGVFDGVHIGHRSLLSFLNRNAKQNGWISIAVTFKTHPEAIVSPDKQQPWLTDLKTRLRLIKATGVDLVIPLPFNKSVKNMTVQGFTELLRKHLRMSGLVIGPDFAMGCDRQGTADTLRQLGLKRGFSIDVVNPFFYNGEIISSSAIRQLLTEGNVKKEGLFLGRSFRYSGLVIAGDRRGRALGFPTANIIPKPEFAIPGDGVYMTTTTIGRKVFQSVTNVGIRPTFADGHSRLIETHILDYDKDIYNRKIHVDFIDKIRDEKHFDTASDLKKQMADDVAAARALLRVKLSHEETVEWQS